MKPGSGPQNLCSGPKDSIKYAYKEPDRGTTTPNSAKTRAAEKSENMKILEYRIFSNSPKKQRKPQQAQTVRHKPTDPVYARAEDAETNIPEPIIEAII